MKILQICHKPPYPPSNGGSIAMNNIAKALLREGHQVMVMAIESPNHPIDKAILDADYQRKTNFQTCFVDTTPKVWDALCAFFKKQSYRVQRYYSKNLSNRLMEILQENDFDIIQLETPFTSPYIPLIRKYSNAKIVFRPHKIEHLAWARIAKLETNYLRKILLQLRIHALERCERELGRKVDACIAISDSDYQYFSQQYDPIPCTVIPVGLDLEDYEMMEEYLPSARPTLFNLSSMDVLSNVEGLEWFLKEVWPAVTEQFPFLKFHLAGKNVPAEIQHLATENIIFDGEVQNSNDFMRNHDLMIVPLLSGSGVQVKIIEAMALGKTVITTPAGAESLRAEHGKQLLVADTPDDFVMILKKCIHTPDVCAFIGENARNFVSLQHNNDIIIKQLVEFYQTLNQK